MIIRDALPNDAEAINGIRVRAWQLAYGNFMPEQFLSTLDSNSGVDGLRSAIQNPKPQFKASVAEVDGAVIGFSMLGTPRFDAPDGTIELWALNIDPIHWRKGIGLALVREALASAKLSGAGRVELWCIVGNSPASRLYEAAGFLLPGMQRTTSSLTGFPLHEVSYANTL